MRAQQAADQYLTWCEATGKAVNTLRNRRTALDRFVTVNRNPDTRTIDATAVDRFVIASQHLSDGSFNLAISNLRGWLRWMRVRGLIQLDVDMLMASITRRKNRPPERRRIPLTQFPVLLEAAGRRHPRDRMVVAAGLYLFLRASEIRSLRVKDVDLASGEVTVTIHKTRERDVMPISAELDRELRLWLTWYADNYGPLDPDWWLCPAVAPTRQPSDVDYADRPLSPQSKMCANMAVVQQALAAIGWEDTCGEGVHCLRRSAARALFDELAGSSFDGAMRRVMSLLHHKSQQTTETYLGLTVDKAQRDKAVRGHSLFPSLEGATNWSPYRPSNATDVADSTLRAIG